MSMTDLSIAGTLKNNLTEGDCGKFYDPLQAFEVLHGTTTPKRSIKSDENAHCSTNTIDEQISPASVVSEQDFFDISRHTNDELGRLGTEICRSSLGDEPDRALCINKMKSSKSAMTPDLKYNVDKHGVSSNGKSKSSSSFSIFGQLLNKKQNASLPAKSSGNTHNFSFPATFKQSSPPRESSHRVPERVEETSRPQMKTKLRSMWNNVKYGWKVKREVNLKTDSAIWLLGQCYHNKLSEDATLTQNVTEQLRLDLLSKIWLTYRVNFPAIPGTNIVTDSGWGCMLRCGQMMMAQAFVCHFLQRDWRLSSHQPEAKNHLYKTILRWFGDSLSDRSPFSLHHLVSLGENYGRKAGDWYGPTHAAHVLRDALTEAKKHYPVLQQICMYVASDGIVFKEDVMELFLNPAFEEKTNSNTSLSSDFATVSLTEIQGNISTEILEHQSSADFHNTRSRLNEDTSEEPKSFETTCPSYSEFGPPSYDTVKPKSRSLILFVSVRLGNDKINPFYIPCLKSLLAYENCIGIIGGRPKHALYFIGWQDDKIIHMDPHSCQPAIDVEKEDFNEKSFHSSSVRMMSFSEMDPSCSIGFYFRDVEEFQHFVEKFSEITAPLKRNLEYPIFALADGKRVEVEEDICQSNEKSIFTSLGDPCIDDSDDDDDNEFILL